MSRCSSAASSRAASAASSYTSHTAASSARNSLSTDDSTTKAAERSVSSRAAFRDSLSRVQQLFGLAEVTQQPYSSSRLVYIPLELLRCTAEERPARNLLVPGKKSYWSTGSGQNHELVFKIESACLLGFVKVLNRSVSHLEIYVSMHDVANQYVMIQNDLHSPHNKTVMYPIGFLPCRYVKIKCVRGTPVALYNVSVVGVLERSVWREMGPEMGSTLVEHPEALLLPSKPHLLTAPSLTFPAHQSVKAQEPQPRIQQCTR